MVGTAATGGQAAEGDVPWLSENERHAWIAFTTMLMTLPPAVDTQLKHDSGVNFFEYTIMAGLSDAPEHAMRMSVLAEFAAGSMSRLSHAVTRLERQGWVARRSVPSEARAVEAVLTPAGRAFMRDAAPGHVRHARRLFFDSLTPEQVAIMGDLSRTLVASASSATAKVLDDVIDVSDGAAEN